MVNGDNKPVELEPKKYVDLINGGLKLAGENVDLKNELSTTKKQLKKTQLEFELMKLENDSN